MKQKCRVILCRNNEFKIIEIWVIERYAFSIDNLFFFLISSIFCSLGGLFSEIGGEEDQIFKYAGRSVIINNGTVTLEPISELVTDDDCLMASKAGKRTL